MGNDRTPGAVDSALAAVEDSCEAAVAAIGALSGPRERFAALGQLAALLRARSDEMARLRHDEAARIREDEKLSLAALARRVGISKARADQITRARRQ